MTSSNGRGMALHTKMLIGFAIGAIAGLSINLLSSYAVANGLWLVPGADGQPVPAFQPWVQGLIVNLTEPVGQLFLRLLFMLVVPLVFSALILGVVEIGDPRALGRLGGKTLAWVFGTTFIAVLIGLAMTHLLQPGVGIDRALLDAALANSSAAGVVAGEHKPIGVIEMLLNMVPRNPIAAAANTDLIAVMCFALLFGIAAAVVDSPGTRSFVSAVQGVYDISLKLIDWVIRLAPYAVAALLFTLSARMGLDLMLQLGRFVGTAAAALGVHFFVVYPLLIALLGRRSPLEVFRGAQPALLTAFSTSSSAATLPTSLKTAEENLGVPRRVARFVCTLGATVNMNGTALYEGVTVLFLAQLFGVELTLVQQLMILVMCVMGGIGAASVPGGSLPVIATILVTFGIPAEGIALILGVDRFLDMCRTTVNIGGDMVASVVIGRSEAAHDHDDLGTGADGQLHVHHVHGDGEARQRAG
ncbi:dicarboxylate/amino acid:cation symporter [Luteimonas sp. S4-F44]|uniref:dicarboxylate/amino acid:cation symporter n=1 Tax=Luteimonas sp. S4-F44 TaxID=2925842 RepID=UPI001F53C5EF|nr:dicarboxylate/amino acid:cation symporter [Luteimonas sp. S4-F44]UNK41789.1 dicarboxylate/amino acid:cation symporter [Luteimonas sp. S4-F44]